MVVDVAKRVFVYDGITLPDPGADLDEKGVLEFYAPQFPELTNAGFDPPSMSVDKDGKTVATFNIAKKTGTKG